MFRLGVVGHRETLQFVRRVVEEYFDGVTVSGLEFGNDADLSEAARGVAELQGECDGLLYSRKDPYLLLSGMIGHTVPVRYVDIDRSHLLVSLLAATVRFGPLPDEISVDSFDQNEVRRALADVGVPPERTSVRCVAVKPHPAGLVAGTLEQHLRNHEAGSGLCVTNITDVYESLLARGVPAALIAPSAESFVHEIRNLMLRHELPRQDAAGLAIVHIRLQYKGQYRYYGTMPIREVDDLGAAAKAIAVFAEELDSAMFQTSRWEYLILCDRALLEDATDGYGSLEIMDTINQATPFDVAVGVGCGGTVKEAEANALAAMGAATLNSGTNAVVVPRKGTVLGPVRPRSEHHQSESVTDANLDEVARRSGVGAQVVRRLYELSQARNSALFTSRELGRLLGVSPRTANRLLARLLARGYAAVEGKDLTQSHGRPARVVRLRF